LGEIAREGKLGITASFNVIVSDLGSKQETKSEREAKLTHTCLNKSIPHETPDFRFLNIQLLATGRLEEVKQ
jgi:hypothetical protein